MSRSHCPATTEPPGLEIVHFTAGSAARVRAWHSPERWVQAPDGEVPASDPDAFAALCEHAGVLPAPRRTDPRPLRIVLVGTGVLARTLASQLAEHLDTRLVLTAPQAPDAARTAVVHWQADLAGPGTGGRVAIMRTDPCEVWTPGTLVVVASDTIEADRTLLARLARRGADHLTVTSHLDRAVVGPWVSSASVSCLSCLDHWRAGLDADYPAVLDELCRRPVATRPAVVQWAASTLVTALLRPDAGRGLLDSRLLELDLCDPGAGETLLRAHPRCTCHAAGADLEGLAPAA